MKYTVTAFGETKTYERKVSLLEILGDRDPDKKIIACRVNNRIRSLTYELYKDSKLEFIDCKDPEAVTRASSLRSEGKAAELALVPMTKEDAAAAQQEKGYAALVYLA